MGFQGGKNRSLLWAIIICRNKGSVFCILDDIFLKDALDGVRNISRVRRLGFRRFGYDNHL